MRTRSGQGTYGELEDESEDDGTSNRPQQLSVSDIDVRNLPLDGSELDNSYDPQPKEERKAAQSDYQSMA